jgi:hypothetical protein
MMREMFAQDQQGHDLNLMMTDSTVSLTFNSDLKQLLPKQTRNLTNLSQDSMLVFDLCKANGHRVQDMVLSYMLGVNAAHKRFGLAAKVLSFATDEDDDEARQKLIGSATFKLRKGLWTGGLLTQTYSNWKLRSTCSTFGLFSRPIENMYFSAEYTR